MILRKIYGIYGFLIFSVILASFFPVYLIAILLNNDKARYFMLFISHKIFAPLFMFLTFIKIKVFGKNYIDPNQSYIIVSNHTSSIDFMLSTIGFPGLFKYLAKRDVYKYPVMGFIIKNASVIVDRKDPVSRRKSLLKLKKELAKGYSVFIYPEGTRNVTDELLGKFYTGAFRLAIETGLPILVATNCQIRKISDPRNGLDLWPGTCSIRLSEPIDVSGYKLEDYEQLKDRVYNMMMENLRKYGA